METLQTAFTTGDVNGPLQKHRITEKKHDHARTEQSNESNYVDLGNILDVKDSAKTVKVTFTGEGNQRAIFKCKSDTSSGVKSPRANDTHERADKTPQTEPHGDHWKDVPLENEDPDLLSRVQPSPTETDSDIMAGMRKDMETDLKIQDFLREEKLIRGYERQELRYTDMYLNSRCESEDTSVVPSDKSVDAESHYITTHEIQLTELDHDVDYEFGRSSCWDYDDDNLVYSFVDYASFESAKTSEELLKTRSRRRGKSNLAVTGPLVSTESDFCESDKLVSSDESPTKTQNDISNPTGQIRLSIKASSRAIRDPVSVLDGNENLRYYARRAEDSHYFLTTSDSKEDTLLDRDRAHYFIPAPGRQHLTTNLKGKDIHEYSSGASSSVSELDDADKEVRNLTAKSFRSLACPYFDAINLRTSSESSVSEHGLSINDWSALVDLNLAQRRKSSSSSVEMSRLAEYNNVNGVANMRTTQTEVFSSNNKLSQYSAQNGSIESSKKVELGSRLHPVRDDTDDNRDVYKKAIFASSLLKNVISKKMQLEHARNLERDETRVSRACTQPVAREQDLHTDNVSAKSIQRETSETGSELSVPSQEEHADCISRAYNEEAREGSHGSGAEPDAELPGDGAARTDPGESETSPLARSQNSAFKTWKDGEQETSGGSAQADGEAACALVEMSATTSDHHEEEKECGSNVEGVSSPMKMSHLYVPSSHLVPKERERDKHHSHAELDEERCIKIHSCGPPRAPDTAGQARKAPEIKIHLCSVKEEKEFNIANLLTPKIVHNSGKHDAESKGHALSTSEKVPHFMVRDIRDTKCKLQTPIHQVRDVRKLVKSSYRFVSLENSESKAGVSALCEGSEAAKKEPDKTRFPVPMVIKCQSVNTNSAAKRGGTACETFVSAADADVVRERLCAQECAQECAKSARRARGGQQVFLQYDEPKTEVRPAKQKREKTVDSCDKKPECKFANQVALEKLKAAVKTMEQLYVFDRNEWKRKSEAPRPITDSHVLSLISREEHGFACKSDSEDEQGKTSDSEKPTSSEPITEKSSAPLVNPAGVGVGEGRRHALADSSKMLTKRESFDHTCVLSPGRTLRTTNPTKDPVCLKICPSKAKPESKRLRGTISDTPTKPQRTDTPPKPQQIDTSLPDSENYLTIPVKSVRADPHPASTPAGSSNKPRPPSTLQRSPVVSEAWPTEIPPACHHAFPAAYPHHLCFSPPTECPAPNTQRKLLVDPATGQCYLVDTPIPLRPAIQRLYYPDSGQYLDMPLSVAPMPLSPIPPISLSPAATYAPAYLFCPPALVSPNSQAPPACLEGERVGEAGPPTRGPYITPLAGGPAGVNPLISITSQQGARIIAPPSFDGTTVSFVVEHR
ncbi:uncharacterized protein C4orf54-like [Brachyhypopomus gauderio]|uniref:uncharacterized protein C4orf54-like n=1 Tax=Brachyhypopomus gauderio TaxID=698409 RepID=UPI00404378D2